MIFWDDPWFIIQTLLSLLVFIGIALIHWYKKDWVWRYHVKTQRSRGVTNLERTREWEQTTDMTAYGAFLFGIFLAFAPFVISYYFMVQFAISQDSPSDIPVLLVGLVISVIIAVLALLHWYIQWFIRDTAWKLHIKRRNKQNDETYLQTTTWKIFTTVTGFISLVIGIVACGTFFYLLINLIAEFSA